MGTVTNNGCNLFAKLLYGEPGYTYLTYGQIGLNSTAALATDTDMIANDGSSINEQVERVPPVCSLIDDCSNPALWVAGGMAGAPVANTTNYKEGYGTVDNTALDLSKPNPAANFWFYSYNGGPFNIVNGWVYFWLYIKDAATLAKFQIPPSAVNITFSANPGVDFDRYTFQASEFSVGWNLLCCDTSNPDVVFGLGCNWAAMTDIRLTMYTNNAADVIAVGDVAMDFWHYAFEPDYQVSIQPTFPKYDTTLRQSETRYRVPNPNALGYYLREFGEFNNDSPKIMSRKDTYIGISKSSKDDVIYILKLTANPV